MEQSIACFINQEDGTCVIGESDSGELQVVWDIYNQLHEKTKNLSELMLKDFKKFSKILLYITTYSKMKSLEQSLLL